MVHPLVVQGLTCSSFQILSGTLSLLELSNFSPTHPSHWRRPLECDMCEVVDCGRVTIYVCYLDVSGHVCPA